jgi:hypothetical protein
MEGCCRALGACWEGVGLFVGALGGEGTPHGVAVIPTSDSRCC